MIKALLFDLNGTLIDICTSENDDSIYRTTANFLDYYDVKISPEKLKDEYFHRLHQQKDHSDEKFPEFDVVKLFAGIINDFGRKNIQLDPEIAATVFRASGRYRLQLYDGVNDVLEKLSDRFQLAAVSDGQTPWALPELHSVGLDRFFPVVIVSGEYGFRKPDKRMYQMALDKLQLHPEEVIFVGNDMYRDVYGAKTAGMKTVFFRSNQGDHNFHGAEADYIIYRFPELLNAVDFIMAKDNHSY